MTGRKEGRAAASSAVRPLLKRERTRRQSSPGWTLYPRAQTDLKLGMHAGIV